MSVTDKLACSLGRKDELPNIELAELLCENNDIAGIKEIVDGLKGKNKTVANDCIKVLYEVGERNPRLIENYAVDFISLVCSKNNRLAWGSMMALSKIAEYVPETVYGRLPVIINAYKEGSVITVDNSISVFAGLCKAKTDYSKEVLPVIIGHLEKCRPKDVPQHAERASVCFDRVNAKDFIAVLEKRRTSLMSSQQTRINKLIKKLNCLAVAQDNE